MRYLGNKNRMIKKIEEFIEKNKIDGDSFCDLFSGSASVCDYFKDRYKIIANDILSFSYVVTRAKVKNACVPAFEKFKAAAGEDFFDYFNRREYEFSDSHFIWKNYSPAGGRQYFTEVTANKIDGIRAELEVLHKTDVLSDEEYYFAVASLIENAMGASNTSGTYEAFLKTWDKRTAKEFVFGPLSMENKPLASQDN
ncbi:MAG: DNA adenine methylase, partial [Eubacteriales bacterium]